MSKSHSILAEPFFITLFAILFCIWTALGNDVNICVTTGCTLYQDFTISGVSMWWFGTAAFTLLGVCALLGQAGIGRFLAAFFLFCDTFLLALMSVTAPCVSCLVAAVFFAFSYRQFRRAYYNGGKTNPGAVPHSILVWLWGFFFIINLGLVAKSQLDVWPILDQSGDPRAKMFFSPSCPHCVESVNVLSGNVEMAFYPIADTDEDVYRIASMGKLLNEGMSLSEALGQSIDTPYPGFFSAWSPEMLLLRFRLVRNKSHVFASGSQGVPFFEYRGIPGEVMQKIRNRNKRSENLEHPAQNTSMSSGPGDDTLPIDMSGAGQCISGQPCPPQQQ